MKYLIILFFTFSVLATSVDKIVGGDRVHKSSFLGVVALVYDNNIHCSGVVIAPRVVLTAAHCLLGFRKYRMSIYVGPGKSMPNPDLKTFKGQYEIESFHVHPSIEVERSLSGVNYDAYGVNDIGIVITNKRIRNVPYYPILMDPQKIPNLVKKGNKVLVIGFGYKKEVDPWDDILGLPNYYGKKRKVRVPIVSVASHFMDARGTKKDSCYKDSGGPAFISNGRYLELLGLVSRADGLCGENEFPVYYSLVYDSLCWINQVTKLFSGKHLKFHCDRNLEIREKCSSLPSAEARKCADRLSDQIFINWSS